MTWPSRAMKHFEPDTDTGMRCLGGWRARNIQFSDTLADESHTFRTKHSRPCLELHTIRSPQSHCSTRREAQSRRTGQAPHAAVSRYRDVGCAVPRVISLGLGPGCRFSHYRYGTGFSAKPSRSNIADGEHAAAARTRCRRQDRGGSISWGPSVSGRDGRPRPS